jgi:hypothetical protein
MVVLVVLALLVRYRYFIKMWALVENKTNKVLACVAGVPYEQALKDTSNYDAFLVPMTLENSPAYVNGIWDGNKFYKDKVIEQNNI